MSYIDENLMKDEEIVYRAKIHWAVFLPAAIWTLLMLCCFMPAKKAPGSEAGGFLVLFFLLAIISATRAVLRKISFDGAITNKRLILKKGVISRTALDLVLQKCEAVGINQSIFGRIFGYGTIIATTGGVTNKYPFVQDPMVFKNNLNTQISLVYEK